METSIGDSLRQQLASVFSFTEVSLPEMKRTNVISGHESCQSSNLSEGDPLFGASIRIPSRPRSKRSLNPKRVVREQIPPVTPKKNESKVDDSENDVEETNPIQRKWNRMKYKPKVVNDGASRKISRKPPGDSKSHTTNLKDTSANAPITPDLKPHHPNFPVTPITPELKLANHEAPVTCESKFTTTSVLLIDPKKSVRRRLNLLAANEANSDLGDKTDAVMHGELQVSLSQGEMGEVKCLMEDIDRIGLKEHLIHLTAWCLRGVKRGRPKKEKKLHENALVPYQQEKLKYRGIVHVDEESLLEWNRLMGGPNSAPELNPDREEKWHKERDTFRNLAQWFISTMKLIQGNRCFSEWKGSVVDSVVGAFLTQNVNDQLSSSSFISLCARFPRRQDGDVTMTENMHPDIEGTKSHIVSEPTCVVDIVDSHIEVRPQKVPEGNKPLELTKEGNRSPKMKKVNIPKKKDNVPKKKAKVPKKEGYKIGMEDIDWDALRKEASCHGYTREGKAVKTEDAADWDAVRQADTKDVADAIRGRGQENNLAKRIQDFLNRLVKDHGSMDLEWLRKTPGDRAKEYLLSIYGLGLKSVECVRLLSLHQVAFPVDTNVARISVRLGWVPLQPLPESVQIHLLESYPVMDSIQKYLWPRLCKLDLETLYELHYQMITFGKVFCTKSKPNCNACPLRSDCKHFASAFSSARLMLPGPQQNQENKVVLWTGASTTSENASNSVFKPTDVPTTQFEALPRCSNSEPIIEEPMTPEEETIVEDFPDIEDICFHDPDEIPTINLNMESFVRNIEEHVKKYDSELQTEDMSKALVLLPPIAASIPPPLLKHSRHLRTVHEAYEVPDGHPILLRLGFEARDPADPSPYLLILSPLEKEDADSKPCSCNSCNEAKSCYFSKEDESSYVKCSFLIPCRTAMRGSFPLNGTYFQVNEVFADHCTAGKPVMVPTDDIWMLRRCPVYFGSTVSSILKGLPTNEIQECFWRGFVCVREFDRVTRYPKPLSSALHLAPSKKKKIHLAPRKKKEVQVAQ